MPISPRSLLVLALDGAHADVWPRLAREAGLDLVRVASLEAFHGASRAIGIVAADGDAGQLCAAFRELANPPLPIAAVASGLDHRAAVALCRAGASEVFVLEREYPLVRTWLVERATAFVPNGVHLERLDTIIRRTVGEAVEACGGNKSDAARRLGISRTRLQRLLRAEPRNRSSNPVAERADA
ncbi:MAG TPA: helix-turn-helix domain-containing protein [Gemmatimonadaceae bacterium]|nr:helix-turn-helix domain-containing protein [Gemmatimonadaceae bacterium]